MNGLNRGALAALLLEHELPDGAVAGRVLLEADISAPLTMRTAPDPDVVPALWRANWVKAATMARSCNDPTVLGRLARHSSVQVRRTAAANPALSDVDRRALEDQARSRDDYEMLDSVITGASWPYLAELLGDPARWQAPSFRWNNRSLQQRYGELAHHATQTQIESMIASGAATTLNVFLAINDQVDRLALTTDERLGQEQRNLGRLLSATVVVDRVFLDALERCTGTPPGSVIQFGIHCVAPDLGEDDRTRLVRHSKDGAMIAFVDRPGKELLDVVEQHWGLDGAARALMRAAVDEVFTADVLRVERQLQTANGELAEIYLAALGLDHDHGPALLSAGGARTLRAYLSGKFGPVSADRAFDAIEAQYAVDDRTDIAAVIANITDRILAADLLAAIVDRGSTALFRSTFRACNKLRPADAVALVRRMAAEGITTHVPALGYGDLKTRLSSLDLDSETLLTWLRCAGSTDLTVDFIAGRLGRKPQLVEVEQMLADPGHAFEGRSLASAPVFLRVFPRMVEVDLEIVDRFVDAAGAGCIETVLQAGNDQGKELFAAYLADRMRRNAGDGESWVAAFDLLVRSTMPIGDTLRASQRLRRRPTT